VNGSTYASLTLGSCIAGRYRLVRTLGTGGMGTVYAALDLRTGSQVAVKVLPPEASGDPARIERFRRETRAVSQLGHPNTIRAFDAGVLDPLSGQRLSGGRLTDPRAGRAFLVMELLEGEDLHARLRRQHRLSVAEGLAIVNQVAAGLAAAHAQGIVHRDLKPENIFLCHNGVVKVLDFGLAQVEGLANAGRVTAQNALLGTPEYMSPEQAGGHAVDARSDVYALGCMMYEMFTGRPPFTGKSFVAVLMAQLAEAPVPPHACTPPAHIPAALQAVILRMLAKEVDGRPQNMAALQAELAAVDPRGPRAEESSGAPSGPLLLPQLGGRFGEEDPTTLFRSGSGPLPAPPARPGSGAVPLTRGASGSARHSSSADRRPSAHDVPEASYREPTLPPSGRLLTQRMASQPDPLPGILEKISPARPRQLDTTIVIVMVLLAASLVGLAVWLLLR
jgi:serine/threonine-protein kinase